MKQTTSGYLTSCEMKDLDEAWEIFKENGKDKSVDFLVSKRYSKDWAVRELDDMIDDAYDLAYTDWN